MEEGNGVQRYSTEVSFTNFKVKQEYRFVDDLNPSTKTQSHRHHHLRNEMIDVAASSSDEEEGESRDSEDRHSDGETSVSAESILNSSSHPKDDDIEGESMDHHCFDKEFIHDLMLIPTIVQEEPLVNEDLSHLLKTEVHDLRGSCSVPEFIQSRIVNGYETGSFLVTNLASVVKQLQQWQRELPMVEPFYAVKCNPDPNIVRLLASLGCSFDCATMGEIELVCHGLGEQLSFGNTPGKAKKSIVYANPAKMQHMLEYAIENEVGMTVFDGEDELYKIAETPGYENIQLLLRLTTDDKASICRFSKKFGCPVAEAPRLLDVAKELGLNIAGVSFHVGSGCGDAGAYATALEHARIVFEEGLKRGMPAMTVVDIGGGFPGGTEGVTPGMPTFFDLAATIRSSIADFLKVLNRPASEIRFIAEPGRYFVSESTTIATKIYSRKGGKNKYQAIYVDDGVYGSFNNVVYDHALPIPKRLNSVLANTEASDELIPTAVFGPTCDGLDQMCSLDTTTLPRCEVGEWLIWPQQGAYTHTASFVFNGYTHIPKKTYCYL